MATWSEFRRAVWLPRKDSRFRPSSDADLDAFEEHAGLKLPVSYREFAKIFGACHFQGDSGFEYKFAAPRRKKGPRPPFNLFSFAAELHQSAEALVRPFPGKNYTTPPQLLRMVFFGSDGGSSRYGWDPGDVSDAPNSEYAVYNMKHTRLASSFEEFVLGFCVNERLARWREAGCPVRRKRKDYDPRDDPRIGMSDLT